MLNSDVFLRGMDFAAGKNIMQFRDEICMFEPLSDTKSQIISCGEGGVPFPWATHLILFYMFCYLAVLMCWALSF